MYKYIYADRPAAVCVCEYKLLKLYIHSILIERTIVTNIKKNVFYSKDIW